MRLPRLVIRRGPARAATAPVLAVMRHRNQPLVVQTFRSTAAATIAFLAALELSGNPLPLTASLTALLVVQVTLYATLKASIRRVISVITGVLLAVAFADFVGFSWWSLGLLILACQIVGHLLRVYPWVPEVAISGMLVLGVGSAAESTALGRVVETLIGAVVGVVFNVTVAPPVYLQPASEAIEELGDRLRATFARIGSELREGASAERTVAWLQEARDIDHEILRVDERLSRVEESLRLNPRALRSPNSAGILRSGLDTLEHCAVTLRGLCRSLADLSQEEGRESWLYGADITASLERLLNYLADAVDSFARMVTAEIRSGAAQAESNLADALVAARSEREQIAELLRRETGYDPETWELHGSLLATVDRLLDELDLEKRAQKRVADQGSRREILRRASRALPRWLPSVMQAVRGRAVVRR